jgi:hypothetical protein
VAFHKWLVSKRFVSFSGAFFAFGEQKKQVEKTVLDVFLLNLLLLLVAWEFRISDEFELLLLQSVLLSYRLGCCF